MSAKKNEYFPEAFTHPGVILKEKLEELGMSNKEFAVRTGKPEQTIIKIQAGKSSITSEMAVQFEDVLKIPAHFWLNYQRNYDEAEARKKRKSVIEDAYDWARSFPYATMAKLGWVPPTKKVGEKVVALFDFFSVSNAKAWNSYYCAQELKVNFRISLTHTQQSPAISAWLRQGEIQAANIESVPYDEKGFKKALPQIKQVMVEHPDDFFIRLQALCLKHGVKVVYTPCLPKAPIHGSTRWINNHPVIQLSARYKQNDIFWFTFFHEVGHILLHGKKYISLESVDYADKDTKKEGEADQFAIDAIFSEKQEKEVFDFALKNDGLSEEDVIKFAEQFNTHPAIIIGRFHHKRRIPFNKGRKFIVPVHLD